MTIRETGAIMDILTCAYPQFYARVGNDEMRKIMSLWAQMFSDDDVKTVAVAVKALISTDTNRYPPSIGAVKAKIQQITAPQEMSEAAAWSLIQKACSNGIYGAQKEFDKLPEICQKLVGSPNQLREWAMMDSETVHSVVASNFQRAYRTQTARDREYKALPKDVQAFIKELSGAVKEPKLLEDSQHEDTCD